MDIKYNVYYSTSPDGPWTLANSVPLDHDQSGNDYTITGLTRGTLYYILVVGGYISGSDFIPLMDQPVGPSAEEAKGVGAAPSVSIAVREYVVRKLSDGSLGHQVEMV